MVEHTKGIMGLGKTINEYTAMANSVCNGRMSLFAEEINSFFELVCSELNPLFIGTLHTKCKVLLTYIIKTDTVVKLVNAIKSTGLYTPNWILRDMPFI